MSEEVGNLYDIAFILFSGSSHECCASCVFEYFADTIVHFGGTFEVFRCSDFTSNCFALDMLAWESSQKRGKERGKRVDTSSGETGRC